MAQTSRELVKRCLTFESPERLPRDMWALPWVDLHHPEEMKALRDEYPSDFSYPAGVYLPSSKTKGEMYSIGECIDEWGCKFMNVQAGVHGEVKAPILPDIADWKSIQPPYEMLPTDVSAARDKVNRAYAENDKYVHGGCNPRPWERYQFLRGSENAMCDIMFPDDGAIDLLRVIHEFHMKEFEFWASTDIDGLTFMDDWGSQNQLLIPPKIWREIFKPMYKDYCDIAHANDKFIFMHTDGHITEIYSDLVEIGVDAINSQLFCMDMAEIAVMAKGKITFWGEIDRQHVMNSADPADGAKAVREVAAHLYKPEGGIIAQFEVGSGGNPAVAVAIYKEWEAVHSEATSG